MRIELITASWPISDVVAGTSTRDGGVSTGPYRSLNLAAHVGDHAANVTENRRRLSAACELPREPLWLNQVHGNAVVFADDAAIADVPPSADAIVSRDGSHVLGILTADCLPIMLCSSARPEIAALHCGWRSLSRGIIAATMAMLASRPAEVVAWLGPAISQPAFEVGDEVRDIFLAGVEGAAGCFEANERGRWQADLYGLARRYLAAAGVEQEYGGEYCTALDPKRFFSYRRDGQCGRMATCIFRR